MQMDIKTPNDIQKDIDATWKIIWTHTHSSSAKIIYQNKLRELHKELHNAIEAQFDKDNNII